MQGLYTKECWRYRLHKKIVCALCVVDGKKMSKIVGEYDQEIPQSQPTDKPTASRGRDTQQPRDTR